MRSRLRLRRARAAAPPATSEADTIPGGALGGVDEDLTAPMSTAPAETPGLGAAVVPPAELAASAPAADLEPAPAAVESARCPVCLTIHEPGAARCPACGARLTGRGLRRPALAAGLAALALVGAGAGWAVAGGRDDDPTTVLVAATVTAPTVAPGPPTITETAPSPTATTGPADTGPTTMGGTETTPAPTSPSDTGGDTTETAPTDAGDDDWPSGTTGYAVFLASRRAATSSRGDVEALRSTAEDRGLSSLGILTSDRYSSLRPGYLVLYEGPFETLAEARDALGEARADGYPDAYARRVAP